MPDINYMTGQQIVVVLEEVNSALGNVSYADAAAALGGGAVETVGGSSSWVFPLKKAFGGGTTVEVEYAKQLWDYWRITGAAAGTTALGAAASAAYTWAQGVLIGTGQGLAATGGLLTLSAPAAVAAAAPLLGVGLGIALYESNPELWTKISNTVVDFCTEGTETISAIITEAGQILLPKGLVDSIKSLFEEEGIINRETFFYNASWAPEGGVIASGYLSSPSVEYTTDAYIVPQYIAQTNATVLHFLSRTPTTVTVKYKSSGNIDTRNINGLEHTLNGTTFYRGVSINTSGDGWSFNNYNVGNLNETQLATIIFDGTQTEVLPEGLFPWTGEQVDLDNLTTTPVYDPSTESTLPYYPVNIPIGDPVTPGSTPQYPEFPDAPYIYPEPGTSTDPEVHPEYDPTRPLTPAELPYIDPFIPPIVIPEIQWPEPLGVPNPETLVGPNFETDPIAEPEPELDPQEDPSLVPVRPSVGYQVATNLDPPQSDGESPDIIFPVPDTPWPTIMPPGSETPVQSGSPGFIQVYHPTPSELVAFGRWLWVTYADVTIDKLWNNPFDGVIGAHEIYATPSDGGYTTIRCGFLDSEVSAQIVPVRYIQINCGSMVIPEYWGNYLDYSPYSRAYIYLPFIGIQEVSVDDIVGHSVNILYHVDTYTGACIAQITCAKDDYCNTLYQFSGNCAVEIPLSGGSQANIKAAMMTADAYQHAANVSSGMSLLGGLGSGLASLLTGNIGGAVGSVLGAAASATSQYEYGKAQHTANMVSGKSIVQHSGNFGASHGAMGIKIPYIFIRRPVQKVVNQYNKLYGYPAHKQVLIGACTGFLRCREVHVLSSLATDEEKSAIEELLKTGVYVTE